jgi:hypothetical protein
MPFFLLQSAEIKGFEILRIVKDHGVTIATINKVVSVSTLLFSGNSRLDPLLTSAASAFQKTSGLSTFLAPICPFLRARIQRANLQRKGH